MADGFDFTSLAEMAKRAETLGSILPEIFFGKLKDSATPTQTNGGLSPLQLALMSQMTTGAVPGLGVNQLLLKELKKMADSAPVEINQLLPDVVGISLLALGDQLYLYRQALDCGPDEQDRTEQILVGVTADLAFGTFQYYGHPIDSGSLSDGSYTGPNFFALG